MAMRPVVKVAKAEKIFGLSHYNSDIIAAGVWAWWAA